MSQTEAEDPFTTLSARRSVVQRLEKAKPYDSMSWNDLLLDMADVYEEER